MVTSGSPFFVPLGVRLSRQPPLPARFIAGSSGPWDVSMRRVVLHLLLALGFFPGGLSSSAAAPGSQRLVAVVFSADQPSYRTAHQAFLETLNQAGFGEGRVKVFLQTPNPDPFSWANSTRKAAAVGAEVIVTYGAPATLAARKETFDVPIVFAGVYDPKGLKIVKTLEQPGGSISGVSCRVPLVTLVKTYGEVHPVGRVGVLFNGEEPEGMVEVLELEAQASQGGFLVFRTEANSPKEVRTALGGTLPDLDVLYLAGSSVLSAATPEVFEWARRRKIPVISQAPGSGERGALVTLEASSREQGEWAARYVAKILSGEKVFDLPVRTPRQVDLVINLETARILGLKVPFQALTTATRVIR